MTQRQDEKFVWNDEHPQVIDVRTVEQLGGFDVRMRFSNGEIRELNLERYLHGPIFEPLRNDLELYGRMNIEGGTIAWPNGADIAPETLYEDSHPVQVKRHVKRAGNTTKRTVNAARRRPVRPAR
jgi:hypothetical protein